VPNRRRRKLSTAMSAVAALAVATPFAVIAVSDLTAGTQPATEHHDFVRAAMVTDLPNELITALQQGLSQFGVNLPPLPTGLSPAGAQPALTSPGLLPGATPPGLTTPGLTAPGLTTPGLTAPGLTTPGLTTPGVAVPPASLTDPALTNPGLTNPALTGANPALTSPAGLTGGLPGALGGGLPGALPGALGGGLPGALPGALGGTDPGLGGTTYPILGDPSVGAPSGGGGIVSDITGLGSQLGVGQAIDLLKGVVMPMITSAAQAGAGAPH
jgi:GLTT repeat (6 copies)